MKTLGYMLAGFVLGGICALGLAIAVVTFGHVPSESGGREMQIAFLWIPLGAMLGAITGLVARLRR
ncbi:MAG: hypothetical protein ACOH2H_04805 [Cypionkella sp.]